MFLTVSLLYSCCIGYFGLLRILTRMFLTVSLLRTAFLPEDFVLQTLPACLKRFTMQRMCEKFGQTHIFIQQL